MNAKYLFAATLAMAVFSSFVVAAEPAGSAAAGRPLTRAEVRAELAGALANGSLRNNEAQAVPVEPYRPAHVSQWRVREEARAAARRGSSRGGERDPPDLFDDRSSGPSRAEVRAEAARANRLQPHSAGLDRGQ